MKTKQIGEEKPNNSWEIEKLNLVKEISKAMSYDYSEYDAMSNNDTPEEVAVNLLDDFITKTLQQQREDLIKETKIDLEDEYDNGFEDGVEQANKHQEKENVVPMANYFNHISPQDLEEIMEWLEDNDYLSDKGRLFKTQFWKLFIRQTK